MASEPKVGDVRTVDQLTFFVWIGNDWIAASGDQADRLSAELSAAREMREVLRELEWSGTINDYDYCPVCNGGYQDHAPDCRLARLIGGGE